MRILYLDGTGGINWPTQSQSDAHDWFVLAGPALKPRANQEANCKIASILGKVMPFEKMKKNEKYEINYHNIHHGSGIFASLSKDKRVDLVDNIFDVIINSKPIIFATVVNKRKHKAKYKNPIPPHQLAMRSTISRFSKYLTDNQEEGLVFADEESHKSDKTMIRDMYSLKRTGTTIRGRYYQPQTEDYLEMLLNPLVMAASDMSGGLQLADMCSRAIWLHYTSCKSDRYDALRPFFGTFNGRVVEPSITPRS
ncbi:MAG: DUF3800 domain-containing protein [Nitrosopumilus sp. H8]|nr:MAG: DUF3800 domain-containing protein [Nitrosopumilus sp. H8]